MLMILFLPCSLGGYPPFSEEIKKHTLQEQIVKGLYSFPKSHWKAVSQKGINAHCFVSFVVVIGPLWEVWQCTDLQIKESEFKPWLE